MDAVTQLTFPFPLCFEHSRHHSPIRSKVQVSQMLLQVVHVSCELSLEWLPLRLQEYRHSGPLASISQLVNINRVRALEEAEKICVCLYSGVVQGLTVLAHESTYSFGYAVSSQW